MNETGTRNPACGIGTAGLTTSGMVHYNLAAAALTEQAIRRNEARLTAHGALVAATGSHTGRSPKDKYIVRDGLTASTVWWDNNKEMSPAHFDALLDDFRAHLASRDLFVQDLIGGADRRHSLRTRVVTEYAWHSLFIRNLLIRPDANALANFAPEMTIIDLPSFRADPARHGTSGETVIAIDLTRMIVLIGGTAYAGEMKKAVFTALNFLLPERGVMPMHCSANVGPAGDAAVFFGLSGTGKTTLSADPARTLDRRRRAWLERGRDIQFRRRLLCQDDTSVGRGRAGNLRHHAALRDGAGKRRARCRRRAGFQRWQSDRKHALRLSAAISSPMPARTGRRGIRRNIIMLTADAFGVMPPIARLTPAQAMYHFLSGYTAKVAGTERGVTEPEATFSTCFGAPFMPRHPSEYGDLLRRLIAEHGVDCWLVNTGWTGGAYGTGRRMPIRATRALLAAALDGSLGGAGFRADPNFGFAVPVSAAGIGAEMSIPKSSTRARPGRTRRPMTDRPSGWSTCSPPTSRASKRMSTQR